MFFGNNSFDGICSYLFAQTLLGYERIAYKLIFHWLDDPYSDGQLRMGAGWKPRFEQLPILLSQICWRETCTKTPR